MEADPFDPLDLRKPAAELRQAALAVEIRAVAGDVLGDHDQLLDPVGGQIPGLVHHVLQGAGTVAAPYVGDGTKGAEVVAALRNAKIGPARARGDHTGDLLHRGTGITEEAGLPPLQDRVSGLYDVTEAADAKHRVDLGQLLQDAALIPLGKAAADDEPAQLSGFFQLRHFQNVVYGLTFGSVDKPAGIDDSQICSLRVRDQGVTRLVQQIEHLFAVDQILGTAKRDQRKGFLHSSSSISARCLARAARISSQE